MKKYMETKNIAHTVYINMTFFSAYSSADSVLHGVVSVVAAPLSITGASFVGSLSISALVSLASGEES